MKIVIITGASSGIGKATALRLASQGFHVVASVRQAKDIATWKSVPRVIPLILDVANEESIQAACREISELLHQAKEVHLVNNAGIAVAGAVEGVPIARWREQFEVNVFGLVRVTQAFLPYIRKTRGRIINISSISGLATSPYLGPYSASKFAVEAISDALRRELKQFGVKVIAVEPGPIATPIWEKNLIKKDALINELSKDLQEAYGGQLEKFRLGVEQSAQSAAPVERVSEVIEKALTIGRPRARYVVGVRFLPAQIAIGGLLPDFVLDGIFEKSLR